MGGRLVIFASYTPLNFSALGVGADPFGYIIFQKVFYVFDIHIYALANRFSSALMMYQLTIRIEESRGFKKNQKFPFFCQQFSQHDTEYL